MTDEQPFDVREQITRIDQMLADIHRNQVHVGQLEADRDRKRQEIKHGPWLAAFAGMTAGAALFAAGAAVGAILAILGKLFLGSH